jgi:hypothetical protein
MGCGSLRGGLEPNFKRLSGLLPSDNGQLANDLQRAKGEGRRAKGKGVIPGLPRNPPIRPRWVRDSTSLSSVQSLYIVELKLSLRTRLAH